MKKFLTPLLFLSLFLSGICVNAQKYNVWPTPIASPNHGQRTLVTNPADSIASPFGWHDTNGQPGPEYTITRGNNVHAFQDREDIGHSSNDEPDGGAQLHFDFPFDPAWEPDQYVDAATVNLFYTINYMHDIAYYFGFDEAAGNFQKNNYGKGGVGNDPVNARAQAGANKGKVNNAFYKHKLEGESPSIYMHIFSGTKKYLRVEEPAHLAGTYITSLPSAGWGAGAYVSQTPVTGEVVIVDDGIENPHSTDACEDILNASELSGKIAMIDRGTCAFSFKALQAQNAGAIGVIICNFNEDIYNLNPGPDGVAVNIPIVMLGLSDNESMRAFAGNGLKVTLVDPGFSGTTALASDLDNTIVIHEYGHGINSRLVGGANILCLDNEEDLAEGWSDFFALALTAQPGDTGEKKRGLYTYLLKEASDEKGLRRYPFSTDMNIMPLTYDDVAKDTEIHSIGEVLAGMLWDMYWAFTDRYGWSADLFDESSGNHKAIRLVFEGLKNMPCRPGFVDARNAILAADEVLYNGENACMIWEVFARRGLGYSADQGSSLEAGDQTEAFDVLPVCSNKIIIEKSVTDLIQAGDDIAVTIKVGNYKTNETSGVVVSDEIPAGTSFKSNSSNFPADVQGNKVVFSLGNMDFAEETTITYTLTTSADTWSVRKFLDDVQDDTNSNWLVYTIGVEASNDWVITDSLAHSGNFAWAVNTLNAKSRQALELNPDVYAFHVEGERPALRFYHRHKSKPGVCGGIIEVREVGSTQWIQTGDEMLRNGYPGPIAYTTFAVPNLEGFSGNSGNGYEATYVDLSAWKGKDIQIRFRFGTDVNTYGGFGWLIDDIEFMDLVSYNGEACVTSDQGDHECTIAPEEGTIVDSKDQAVGIPQPSNEIPARVFPNPATDLITVTLSVDQIQEVNISLMTLDGKQILQKTSTLSGNDQINISTGHLPSGMYVVKVNTAEGIFVDKILIHE